MLPDYRAANPQVELVPRPIPDKEVMLARFHGFQAFCSLELLQVYWNEDAFSGGETRFVWHWYFVVLHSPIQVLQGILYATAFSSQRWRKYVSKYIWIGA